MQQSFSDKAFVDVLTVDPECPLSFHDRLVYSRLIYRARYGQGDTQRALAQYLGLDEGDSIPRTRDALLALGLVELKDKELLAVEPAGEVAKWFRTRNNTADWTSRYAYFRLYLPSSDCPLTVRQMAVFCILRSLKPKGKTVALGQTAKGLAKLLGIDRGTVRTALNLLSQHGMLTLFLSSKRRGRFAAAFPPLSLEHQKLFRNAVEDGGSEYFGLSEYVVTSVDESDQSTASSAAIPSCPTTATAGGEDCSIIRAAMEKAGYPRKLSAELAAMVCEHVSDTQFAELFSQAEREHRISQTNGKFLNMTHSGILLRHKLRKQVEISRAVLTDLTMESRDYPSEPPSKSPAHLDEWPKLYDPLHPEFAIAEPLSWQKFVDYDCVMRCKKYLATFGEETCRVALSKSNRRQPTKRKAFEELLTQLSQSIPTNRPIANENTT